MKHEQTIPMQQRLSSAASSTSATQEISLGLRGKKSSVSLALTKKPNSIFIIIFSAGKFPTINCNNIEFWKKCLRANPDYCSNVPQTWYWPSGLPYFI